MFFLALQNQYFNVLKSKLDFVNLVILLICQPIKWVTTDFFFKGNVLSKYLKAL